MQIALVLLLKSWGVKATTVTGHSSGEIAAAFAAGLISQEAAVAVAYFRGLSAVQLSRDHENGQKGAMLALGVSSKVASELVQANTQGYAIIAAINSPESVTVSGDEQAIINIHEMANARSLFARRLRVNVAYHSRHMEQVAASYLASIEPFCKPDARSPAVSDASRAVFISSVTGEVMDTLDASYWIKNLVQPVRFADAIQGVFASHKSTIDGEKSLSKPANVILEIGPHSALKGPIKQTVDSLRQLHGRQGQDQFTYLASLVRGTDSEEALLILAQNLFVLGSPIDLAAINQTDHHNAHVLANLPAYAWDRSVRYVLKSRITQAKLHPGQTYHPLLGWKSPYAEGGEVVFRQVFTLDEVPWIRDHNVGGEIIFPMTGYLSLAMEAVRKTTSTCPSSLLVSEFHAQRSLEIKEDEKVDMTTKLRPAATGTENFSPTAWVFEILTWSPEYGWTAHCHGRIEAEANEVTSDTPTFKASAPLIDNDKLKERDPEVEYMSSRKEGTLYGPSFKRMVRFWEGRGWTVMENELRDMDLSQPSPKGSPISVDTPTLDSFLQGLGPFLEPFGDKPAMMPNYVSRLRISNNIAAVEKLRMTVVTRFLDYDVKAGTMRVSVAVFIKGPESLLPVVEMESVTYRTIASGDSGDSSMSLPASYYWDLIPSLDNLADNGKLRRVLEVEPVEDIELLRVRRLNQAAVHYMDQALQKTAGDDDSQIPSHLSRFKIWAKSVTGREKKILDDVDISSLLTALSSSGGQGEMMCAVGEQLTQILRGEVQALEIMLKDDRLSRWYEDDMTNVRLSHILARWVRHRCDVKSNLRVLEIGAGTGSATLPVFQELSRGGELLPDSFTYTYTDISTGFFESARDKLTKWSKYITYKKLDISQDPVQQGFVLEDYDLVIASNVLHATPNMANTIDNVRSLLRPNGKLILLEAGQHVPLVLPFALLTGWWLAEDDYRSLKDGPLLSQESWSRVLSDRGFSGVDGVIEGFPDRPDNILSIISSTRVALEENVNTAQITICGPLRDNEEEDFAQMVSDMVADHLGCETTVKPFAEIDVEDDPFCVFIDSPSNSLLKDVSSDTFDVLKKLIMDVKGLLWVISDSHSPNANMITGILRTVRQENGGRSLLTLDKLPYTSDGAAAITRLTGTLRDPEYASSMDADFTWHEDMMYLPRYRPLASAKQAFASEAGVTMRQEQKLWQDDVSFEMTVDAVGSPDSIYWKRNNVLRQSLGEDEILIKIEASGVNFRDVLLVLGSIPWTRPGFEGSGVVLQTGSSVTDLQPGDRVFFGTLTGGSFSTHLQLPSWAACRIPDGFTSAEAAGISVAYTTAVMALSHIGRLRKGESLLIHAASGAVGQACIILARHIGANVFVTAGSSAKREFLHREFDIPKEHIFSSRTPEFRDSILAITDGKGVDVIVNSVSGSLLQATWDVVADFGRFVEIGKRDLLQNSYLPMRPFDRNVTFSGVDLRTLFLSKPDLHRDCQSEVVNLAKNRVIKPIRPITAVPISQMAIGLRKLQSGQNIGKIVITMDRDERVLAEGPPPLGISTGMLLRPDATYLITGGTGGIGLSLAPWMVENGARNVVLLGRSGSSRLETQKVLGQYDNNPDVNMRAIACDVGRREDVVNALQSIQDLPPVSGVIHGALFLNVGCLHRSTKIWLID